MRITLSTSELVDELVAALRAGECLAARTGDATIEVGFPWQLLDDRDQAKDQARIELGFFLRTWLACHPGVRATVFT